MSDIVVPISITPKLVGHEKAESDFLNQYKNNRLHHAFLITGNQGIGKCGLAVRMARFLLSNGQIDSTDMFGGENLDFDETSPLAQQIANCSHPDFTFLHLGMNSLTSPFKPMNVIGVDHIRNAIDLTNHTASGTNRVIIIDDAHTMNRQAENALLKTLEEPNPNCFIILCTSQVNSLLPTIRSRCSVYNLNPISDEKIKDKIKEIKPNMADEEASAYTYLAGGSIGTAINLVNNEALSLYSLVINALKNGGEDVYSLATAISTKKNEHNFNIFKVLFDNFLHRLLLSHAKGENVKQVIAGEDIAFDKITAKYKGLNLIEWIENSKNSIAQTSAPSYLDIKSVILTLFLPLHETN
ncbi:MAG: AAA family ATPase [Alphaproteobacteria bacterium]